MKARAESSVIWPGITPGITALRANCSHCNTMAPLQPSAPLFPPTTSVYPFQSIFANFFQHKGFNYLIMVDRHSSWPIIERGHDSSKGLINCLRRTFVTFSIPDECETDGGLEFTAATTQQSLKECGIHHQLSSIAFPYFNCRVEIEDKTVKWLITNNTDSHRSLDTNILRQATLQYRDTPDLNTVPTSTHSRPPLLSTFSAGQSKTSSPSYQAATNPTLPEVTPWLLGKRHSETGI